MEVMNMSDDKRKDLLDFLSENLKKRNEENDISKYSTKPYESRFGSWRKALLAFIEYINEGPSSYTAAPEKASTAKASRNINPRLRFLVMQRDYFKCCACGASPAKDPAVTLHVDHIIPWSKGGPTEMENLQTLCSKCNLGKGDLEF